MNYKLAKLRVFLINNNYKDYRIFEALISEGDYIMDTVYNSDGIKVDLCFNYWYVFHYLRITGLTHEECISLIEVGMSNDEAIKYLEKQIEIQPCRNVAAALKIGIRALEKGVTKKVQYDEYGKEEGYPYCSCGKCLIDDFVGVSYCPNCGQKLDWD